MIVDDRERPVVLVSTVLVTLAVIHAQQGGQEHARLAVCRERERGVAHGALGLEQHGLDVFVSVAAFGAVRVERAAHDVLGIEQVRGARAIRPHHGRGGVGGLIRGQEEARAVAGPGHAARLVRRRAAARAAGRLASAAGCVLSSLASLTRVAA